MNAAPNESSHTLGTPRSRYFSYRLHGSHPRQMGMKVLSVLGARPQFIKAAPVTKALRESGGEEYLVHTGQHYDYEMSKVFFEELEIPEPAVNLEVRSDLPGVQLGRMLQGVEREIREQQPDWVLVYGDTNSTLAGALAAAKSNIPLAHVEAGLRSFNREMPEEHNRVLTDHCSELLFCPTRTAVENLSRENIRTGVHLVGDTMFDAVMQFGESARRHSKILAELDLPPRSYLLATLHRPYNTDVTKNLIALLETFIEIDQTILFPLHPRTRKKIAGLGDAFNSRLSASRIRLLEPVGYLDMLSLEQNARMILTDSGGMQKEAYFFGVPCITLRPETEWLETTDTGWNLIVGTDRSKTLNAVFEHTWPQGTPPVRFGDGNAAYAIAGRLLQSVPARSKVTS